MSAVNSQIGADIVSDEIFVMENPKTAFKDRASAATKYGIPVAWAEPGEKVTHLPEWHLRATTDDTQIDKWNAENENRNSILVAQAKMGGFWFLDIDKKETLQRIKAETGQTIPDWWMSRSQEGRGHFGFKQSPASIAMGNIPETMVKDHAFSCRVDDMYIIGPLSYRKDLNRNYEYIKDVPPVEAPQWLIDWILKQRIVEKPVVADNDNDPIAEGGRNARLASIAGKLRNAGSTREEIESTLLRINEERCQPPLSADEVRIVANSISKYQIGKDDSVIVAGRIAGSQHISSGIEVKAPEIDATGVSIYPSFPRFTMKNTTLFEGLVDPAVKTSSKYAELIWLPAVQLALNYLFGRVRIKDQNVNLNMYLGLISPYGKFFKSSSCELAQKYFEVMGYASSYRPSMRNADGKMVVMQAGSTEGFGKVVSGLNANRAVLYNDELAKMVSKAGIENASFSYDLLSWYGSAEWGNTVLNSKNNFSFPAGSYCFSWQWCTTDRSFNRLWPKIAGIASGMEDRMFFLLSPTEPRATTPYSDPFLGDAAVRTRKALDAAVEQGVYPYEDVESAFALLSGMDPRSMQLAQMLALYFAVDLQEDGERLTMITPECLERALTLVAYRNDVRKYLEPIEADTAQGRIQKEIVREVKQAGGKMKYRDLCRNMDYGRFGSYIWKQAISGMLTIDPPMLVEWNEKTTKGRTVHFVGIPRQEDED